MEPLRDPNPSDLLEVRMPPRRPCLTAPGERLTVFAAAPAPSHPLIQRRQRGEPRLRLEGGVGVKDQALHAAGTLAAGSGPCRGREDACSSPSVVAEPGRQRLFQTAREAGAG